MRTLVYVAVLLGGVVFANPSQVEGQCEDQIRILASVDNPTPYVGEQIIYTSRIENPTTSAPSPRSPSFEGFWLAGSLDIQREQVPGCNGINLGVTTNEKVLFPLDAGEQVIEPMALDFSENPVYEASTRIISDAVTVNVQPLPSGAPDNFTGGVGLFPLMDANIDRATIDAGSPVRLRVTLEGTGNLEQLDAPLLTLPDTWRVYEQASRSTIGIDSTNRLLGGTKTFEWLVFPAETGNITIPPIVFSYFNPFVEAYQSVETPPVALIVLPGEGGNAEPGQPLMDDTEQIAPQTLLDNTWALKPIASLRPAAGALGWGWWLLSMLVAGGAVGYRLYQRWDARMKVRRQQQQAFRNARSRLARVARMKGDVAYQSFLKTLLLYFGEKWEVEPLGLDEAEIQRRLLDEDVPTEAIAALQGCFVAAQQQRYAPQEAIPMIPLIRETLKVLNVVDRALGGE